MKRKFDNGAFGFGMIWGLALFNLINIILYLSWDKFRQNYDGKTMFTITILLLLAGLYFIRKDSMEEKKNAEQLQKS